MKFILKWTDNCKTHFQVTKKIIKWCACSIHIICVCMQIPLVTFKKTNSLGHEADNFLQDNCVPNLTSSASKQLRAFITLLSLSLVVAGTIYTNSHRLVQWNVDFMKQKPGEPHLHAQAVVLTGYR